MDSAVPIEFFYKEDVVRMSPEDIEAYPLIDLKKTLEITLAEWPHYIPKKNLPSIKRVLVLVPFARGHTPVVIIIELENHFPSSIALDIAISGAQKIPSPANQANFFKSSIYCRLEQLKNNEPAE